MLSPNAKRSPENIIGNQYCLFISSIGLLLIVSQQEKNNFPTGWYSKPCSKGDNGDFHQQTLEYMGKGGVAWK
jgi:hypothetical protein